MKECLEPLKIISDLSDLNIEHPSQIKLIKYRDIILVREAI